jgi:hypothetical protein
VIVNSSISASCFPILVEPLPTINSIAAWENEFHPEIVHIHLVLVWQCLCCFIFFTKLLNENSMKGTEVCSAKACLYHHGKMKLCMWYSSEVASHSSLFTPLHTWVHTHTHTHTQNKLFYSCKMLIPPDRIKDILSSWNKLATRPNPKILCTNAFYHTCNFTHNTVYSKPTNLVITIPHLTVAYSIPLVNPQHTTFPFISPSP